MPEWLQGDVFPTRVGVIRGLHIIGTGKIRFPHTRGGDPEGKVIENFTNVFSPHAWG